jgi:hypothetical protein
MSAQDDAKVLETVITSATFTFYEDGILIVNTDGVQVRYEFSHKDTHNWMYFLVAGQDSDEAVIAVGVEEGGKRVGIKVRDIPGAVFIYRKDCGSES